MVSKSDTVAMGLASSNPAAHPLVKRYLTSVQEEQAKARFTARQAIPFSTRAFKTSKVNGQTITLTIV